MGSLEKKINPHQTRLTVDFLANKKCILYLNLIQINNNLVYKNNFLTLNNLGL